MSQPSPNGIYIGLAHCYTAHLYA